MALRSRQPAFPACQQLQQKADRHTRRNEIDKIISEFWHVLVCYR